MASNLRRSADLAVPRSRTAPVCTRAGACTTIGSPADTRDARVSDTAADPGTDADDTDFPGPAAVSGTDADDADFPGPAAVSGTDACGPDPRGAYHDRGGSRDQCEDISLWGGFGSDDGSDLRNRRGLCGGHRDRTRRVVGGRGESADA